jgi:hypothetical protein
VRRQLGWLLWLVCACNELYGLDETKVRPAPPDRDGDGTPDERDLCPNVADPSQADLDGDGFGDACDLCPGISAVLNHDEDGDARGDECDVCPVVPDFQLDQDRDGVGDSCDDDAANPNAWLLFDPFTSLGEPWTTVAGDWAALDDKITSDAQARLRAASVLIDGTKPYALSVGITVLAPPTGVDEFGVELVDDAGTVLVSCLVTCDAFNACRFELRPNFNPVGPNPFTVVPVNELVMRRTPFGLVCLYAGEIATEDNPQIPLPTFPRATLQLVGSPNIQFRHVAIRQ